jgi:septum formation protein
VSGLKLILASSSPRRREILSARGYIFETDPADIDERLEENVEKGLAVERLALRKARETASRHPDDAVLGADTVVYLGDTPLGKPDGQEGAKKMLRMLSGRRHEVITGVAIICGGSEKLLCARTGVKFCVLDDAAIERYVATGEPLGKAGAYAVQGAGGMLVDEIEGDYLNIVGLPAALIAPELGRLGIFPSR